MSLFGKFKMLEQRVNQLALNQPNSLDVSFFGSDRLKKLEQKVEALAQLHRESAETIRDLSALKTAVFSQAARDERRFTQLEDQCKHLRTDITLSQKRGETTLNALERHISRLQKSVDEIESKLASSHHKLPGACARSTPVIRHEPPEERAHYTPARKHSYRTDSEDDHDDGSWAWDEYPGSDFEGA